jgi:hypothetical protein
MTWQITARRGDLTVRRAYPTFTDAWLGRAVWLERGYQVSEPERIQEATAA